MTTTYFRRFCMQLDLRPGLKFEPRSTLETPYELLPWKETHLEWHAAAKFQSFRHALDTNIFVCLGSADGCLRLMRDIAGRDNFLPKATWLAVYRDPTLNALLPCGTIQALRSEPRIGAIQNIGVVGSHRGLGLGTWLIYQSLIGFLQSGLHFAQLEVTAQNSGAIRLYERLGFRLLKVVYKSADILPF